ncbi:L-aspartate oxidase [bacterium HR19]|nr:L-aspartate oxidase [bacterium HR19]
MSSIFDFVVIGSGLAGLSFAIRASKYGSVALITKGKIEESNSFYAQGGIAASPLSDEDSVEKHIEDTIKAGDGLCNTEVVRTIIEESKQAIEELVSWNVEFDREDGNFHLTREGGHSARRILHKGDYTGQEIQTKLSEIVRNQKNIFIFEENMAVDIITKFKFVGRKGGEVEDECYGAYILNKRTGSIETIFGKFVILATGGAGKVYLITTNPDTATGDGVAMAKRAGAKIANMEFYQFHPTVLYHHKEKNFLISEAVRGEGGIIRNKNGEPFMKKYHPMGELAPRDIVARAIDMELKKSGEDHVYLDITHLPKDFIIKRFPKIYQKCLSLGIDITKEPIPVAPGAHFMCGGVLTDSYGETSISRLFAIGEVAYNGFHGANRLASNSLLECVVMSKRALKKCLEYPKKIHIPQEDIPPWKSEKTIPQDEKILISHTWDEIRRLMWNYVGIVRSEKRLQRAYERINIIKKEVIEDYWKYYVSPDLIELRNIAITAELIIISAMQRKESRGTHFNIDYPFKNDIDFKKDTIL